MRQDRSKNAGPTAEAVVVPPLMPMTMFLVRRTPDWATSLASSAPSPPRGTTRMISSASSQRSKAASKITRL